MRWKAIRWGFVLGVVLFVGLVVYEVFKPLPKPVAGLVFMGFTHRADGNYARVCFTNMGATTVYYDCYPSVEIETPKGWVTNQTRIYTSQHFDFAFSSNAVSPVSIPDNTIRWRAKASYIYFRRRCLRLDYFWWSGRKLHGDGGIFDKLLELGDNITAVIPDPKMFDGEVSTALLTNLPSAVIKP